MWEKYVKNAYSEARPYIEGEDMEGISLSKDDIDNGNPKKGGMIFRDPNNHKDMWYVNPEFFNKNYVKK